LLHGVSKVHSLGLKQPECELTSSLCDFSKYKELNFTLIMHIHVTVQVIEAMLLSIGSYHDSLTLDMPRTARKRLLD
jgi:hypothetical protein